MWDISGSARIGYDISLMFLRQIVYGLDFDEQRMALATYSDEVDVRFFLNQYTNRLEIFGNFGVHRNWGENEIHRRLFGLLMRNFLMIVLETGEVSIISSY